jgi:hypothetical protein
MFDYAGKYVPYYADTFAEAGIRVEDLNTRETLMGTPTICTDRWVILSTICLA